MSGPEALLDTGWRHHRAGNLRGAEALYRRAIGAAPTDAEAWCLLGMACHDQARYEDAVAAYQQALRIRPAFPIALSNLGNTLTAQGNTTEGAARCIEAIRLAPRFAMAHTNLGVSLLRGGRVEAATRSFRRAVELRPDHAGIQANLAASLARRGRFDEALRHAELALEFDPTDVEAHLTRYVVWLTRGDLGRGWPEYEWRWKSRFCNYVQVSDRTLDRRWGGSSLNGATLLVWGEQGIGDEIMFAEMYHDVLRQVRRVVLECDPRLVPLFARSFPGADVVPRPSMFVPSHRLKRFDAHCPAGSLGRYLRRDWSSFQGPAGYLKPDAARVGRIRHRYDRFGRGAKVGVSWRTTSTQLERGRRRSTALEQWRPLLDRKGIVWISLQYGDSESDVEEATRRFGVAIRSDPNVDPLTDLDAFGAQVAALDLVITIDNCTAHMAGALGVPVWTLLPYVADPRWMQERQLGRTPWYPTMRVFRQSRPGKWKDVLERVAIALDEWSSTRALAAPTP